MFKKVLVGLVVLGMVLGLSAITGFAFQNEPEGFRGLKWGDPPTVDLKYLDTIGLRKWYELPNDKLSIGNVKFNSIYCSFYDGRFSGVVFFFNGEKNYDLLETICKGRFGEDEMEKGFYKFIWSGMISTVILQYDKVEEEGSLSVFSNQIVDEWIEAKKEKEIEEAKEDW